MFNPNYGYTKTLQGMSMKEVRDLIAFHLRDQGLGILTEIDVSRIMREKLGREFRPYKILGFCNPQFAFEALSADLGVGLLLPCNAILFENDDQSITVSIIKPASMFQVLERPSGTPLWEEVDRRLQKVFEAL